jgi:hypothetical protein
MAWAIAILLVAGEARAVDPFVTFSAGGGLQNQRYDGPPPNLPVTQGYFLETTTMFTDVSGRLGLVGESETSRQQLSYQAGLRYQFTPLDTLTLSHLVGYQIGFSVGDDGAMTLAATGAATRGSTLSTLRGPGDPLAGGALPVPTPGYVYAASITETFTTPFGERWGLMQSTGFGASYTPDIGGTPPLTAQERIGPTLTYEQDQLRLTVDAVGTRGPQIGRPDGIDYQLAVGPTIGWRHNLSERLTSTLEAGLVQAWDVTNEDLAPLGYSGAARLRYMEDFGTLEGFLARAYAPSLFAGQILITNAVGVTGRKPLVDQVLAIDTTLSAQRSESAVSGGPAQDPFNTYVADMGVAYVPNPILGLSLRYQLARQDGTSFGAGFRSSTVLALATLYFGAGTSPPLGAGGGGAPLAGGSERQGGVEGIAGLRAEGESAEPPPARGGPAQAPPPPAPVW